MRKKIRLGDRVRVHLFNRQGQMLGAIEGTVSDFAPNTEVAPGMNKNLVLVSGIENYQRSNESGEMEDADFGWFADTDVEIIDVDLPELLVHILPGSAPPEAIADVLSDISILYEAMGGSGITFTLEGVLEVEESVSVDD